MRYFFLLAFLFCARPALAEKVNVSLNDIAVNEFAYFVLNDLRKESFLFDDDFLALDKRITARFNDAESEEVLSYLKIALSGVGYSIVKYKDVSHVSRTKPETEDVYVYFPKFRGAGYLKELAGTVVDPAGFSTVRGLSGDGLNPVTGTRPSINDTLTRKVDDAIVYRGSFADVARLSRLVGQIDRPSGEVLVKAVIYEVRKGEGGNNAMSVALGLLDRAKGLGVSLINGVLDASSSVRLRLNDVDAAWSVLSGDSRFKVVSAPVVRVRDGEHARFLAGAEVPTLGNVTYTNNGQPVQSVEYQSSGVILDLKPQIREDEIVLSVTHQLSTFQKTDNSSINSPTLLKRELKTSVSVRDDELFIMGGLDETRESASSKGVPFLPGFLRGSRSDSEATEILLMLHVKRI